MDTKTLRPFQKFTRESAPQSLALDITNKNIYLNRVTLDALGRPAYVQFWLDEQDRIVICEGDHFNSYVVHVHGRGGYINGRPVRAWAKAHGYEKFRGAKDGKYVVFAPEIAESGNVNGS